MLPNLAAYPGIAVFFLQSCYQDTVLAGNAPSSDGSLESGLLFLSNPCRPSSKVDDKKPQSMGRGWLIELAKVKGLEKIDRTGCSEIGKFTYPGLNGPEPVESGEDRS